MCQELSRPPDDITMAAILLLKSRLEDNSEVADALNRNIPKVGSTIEITADEPFEKFDIERLWNYMLEYHRGFTSRIDEWAGNELVNCGVNFILDGSLRDADLPNARLEDLPGIICDYAAASLGDEDEDSEADETLTRWSNRVYMRGW